MSNKSSVEPITQQYVIPGTDFTRAGEASSKVKTILKRLGYDPDAIRRVAIAMYEGEINMVIRAHGGTAKVEIFPDRVEIALCDQGPGISDVSKAMEEGYSTAPDEVRALGFGAGMGLPNMKKCSDDMRVHSIIGKDTDVYMTIRVRGTGN